MKKLIALIATAGFALNTMASQLVVFVRHGERPKDGLGQLSCKGLNRAMALPHVLSERFGKPDYIFAPAPSLKREQSGLNHYYVRPLATIEPTAVKFGLPVNLTYKFSDATALANELKTEKYHHAVIFVSWYNQVAAQTARSLVGQYKCEQILEVPKWDDRDFDSLYIVNIDHNNKTASFSIEKQGLDDMPLECP